MDSFTRVVLTFLVHFVGFWAIFGGEPLLGLLIIIGWDGALLVPPLTRELLAQRDERSLRRPEPPQYDADGNRDYTPRWVRETRAQMNRYDQTHDWRNER